MTTENIIKDIRKRCRLAMNGVASSSMRNQGLVYKLNFGVPLQKIKEIAKHYQPDTQLAESLWKEDVRELKILSTLLYPLGGFDVDKANKWVAEIPNQEVREQICINLLQKLPYAQDLANQWINSESEDIRTTGYWLLSRLLISKQTNKDIDTEEFIYLFSDIQVNNVILNKAVLLLLKQIGRTSLENARKILSEIKEFQDSSDPSKKEIYDSLCFEFEYYFENQ